MTARTRTAKKAANATATPAPAKKATAKRTPAKPRTRKTTPGLSMVKEHPAPAATVVDLREPLAVRRRVFVGPHKPAELAAIRAALASAAARLPVPVRAWNGPTAHLADGTVLTHTPAYATTDQPPTFTATIRCPHGAAHVYPVHNAEDLHRARQITALCDQRTPQPKPPAVHSLPEGIRRATASAHATQPLSGDDIAAGLATRAADTEQPKEHPQP